MSILEKEIKKSFDLSVISKYRSIFFVISILLIMIHHTACSVPTFIKPMFLFLRDIGAMGVDIFMFFSGVGCYYSMSKNGNAVSFWKRRLLRVYPSYLLIMIPFMAYLNFVRKGSGILQYVYDLSLIGFWINGDALVWFVAAILFLYLLYPAIHQLLTKFGVQKTLAIICSVWLVISAVLFFVANSFFFHIVRLLVRVPTFLVGCAIAKYMREGKRINGTKYIVVSSILLVVSMSFIYLIYRTPYTQLLHSCVKRLLYGPLAVSLVGVISYALSKTKKLGDSLAENRLVTLVSAMTLELYLVHERVIFIGKELVGKYAISLDKFRILNDLIYAVISVGIAYAVWCLSSCIQKLSRQIQRYGG